jgi:hypothetical protein
MKLKLNLNGAAIKGLAMQHGEKALFGVAVFVLLMFIWSAAKTDVLGPDKQPDKLKESAEKSDQWVLSSKWDPKAKGVEVVDYVKRAKRDPLVDKDYRLAVFFDKPLWESKSLRPDPKVLAIEELQAAAGLGIFALNPPDKPDQADPAMPPKGKKAAPPPPPVAGRPAHGDLKGLSWVVVTGLVPLAKQEAEFEEAFHNVKFNDPAQDFPEFAGLRIERAEVADAAAPPNWQPLNMVVNRTILKSFRTAARELVDDEFIDAVHTVPLGPLVGSEWTYKVVGHSSDKIKPFEKPGARSGRVETTEPGPAEDIDDGGVGLVDPHKAAANAPIRAGQPGAPRPAGAGGPKRKHSEYVLFRIVDYTVEPGKQYTYRVQRRLLNPNRSVAEKWLKDPTTRVKKVIESPWCAPTPVVTVPRDIELFAGAVIKPGARDLQVKVLIRKLDRERGLQVPAEGTFGRGSLLNISKPKVKIDDAEINEPLDSNSVLVDLRGGDRLSIRDKSLIEPVELLILQPDGSLVVHDELDDEEAYAENQGAATGAKKPPSASPLPGGNPYDDLKPKGGVPAGTKKKKKQKKAPPVAAPPKVPKTAS